ncbi:hypothetical protein [Gymnodinialimonas sp.]
MRESEDLERAWRYLNEGYRRAEGTTFRTHHLDDQKARLIMSGGLEDLAAPQDWNRVKELFSLLERGIRAKDQSHHPYQTLKWLPAFLDQATDQLGVEKNPALSASLVRLARLIASISSADSDRYMIKLREDAVEMLGTMASALGDT